MALVSILIAVAMMPLFTAAHPPVTIAVLVAGDGVSGKGTGDTADHRAPDAVGRQSADQRAATGSQRGAGVMRVAAALIRGRSERADA